MPENVCLAFFGNLAEGDEHANPVRCAEHPQSDLLLREPIG